MNSSRFKSISFPAQPLNKSTDFSNLLPPIPSQFKKYTVPSPDVLLISQLNNSLPNMSGSQSSRCNSPRRITSSILDEIECMRVDDDSVDEMNLSAVMRSREKAVVEAKSKADKKVKELEKQGK